MALLQWNDSLKVNVAEIDRQHQRLVGMINELNDAMSQGKGKETLSSTIQGLIRYTGTHFATEEKYFDQFGYPDAPAHKKGHADFVKKVTEFQGKFDAGKLGLSLEVMDFLSDWLQAHIKGEDKKYAPFLNSKGLN